MKKLALIICALVIVGCKKEVTKPVEEECNTVFEVALDLDHYAKDSLGNYIDMPRFHYYVEHNFIIDKSDRIFYYPQVVFRGWNCVVREKMPPIPQPDFINLYPQQIIELTKDQLQNFVKKNLISNNQTSVVISSERDIFKSETLCELYNSFYQNKGNILSILRRMTEEEKVVMKYKKSGEYYYFPDKIKWTSTNFKREKPQTTE